MADCDYFLKIDGIEGESIDDKHKGEIQLLSWSLGVTNSGTGSASGGVGGGKATHQDVHFIKAIDNATAKVWGACAHGEHIKKAVLTCCRAGGTAQDFFKVTFEELIVSSQTTSGSSESGIPTEQFSFNFARISMEYKPQKPDGTLGAAVKHGHDLKANKKWTA